MRAILGFILVLLVGGVLFIYSGLFNVSARWQDPAWLAWILETVRERSIETRAEPIPVPADLRSQARVDRGLEHYVEMCEWCHRAPGIEDTEISKGLNPPPPNLAEHEHDEDEDEEEHDPRELFWVIKNGIRMTGMPAWGVTHDDEEIWDLVAAVLHLPEMSPEEYRAVREKVLAEGGEAGHGHHHDEEHEEEGHAEEGHGR